jgi:hypothetical protein
MEVWGIGYLVLNVYDYEYDGYVLVLVSGVRMVIGLWHLS